MRRAAQEITISHSPEEAMVVRARRFQRKGEHRRAMLLLREACFRADDSARLWTLYAAVCTRAGRRDDAAEALGRALWLRERARDSVRARVTRELLDRLHAGEFPRAA
jgi:Flp pilus assembly protein TadD